MYLFVRWHESFVSVCQYSQSLILLVPGQGWPKEEALTDPTDQHTTLPSKKIVTRVSALNPGRCLCLPLC